MTRDTLSAQNNTVEQEPVKPLAYKVQELMKALGYKPDGQAAALNNLTYDGLEVFSKKLKETHPSEKLLIRVVLDSEETCEQYNTLITDALQQAQKEGQEKNKQFEKYGRLRHVFPFSRYLPSSREIIPDNPHVPLIEFKRGLGKEDDMLSPPPLERGLTRMNTAFLFSTAGKEDEEYENLEPSSALRGVMAAGGREKSGLTRTSGHRSLCPPVSKEKQEVSTSLSPSKRDWAAEEKTAELPDTPSRWRGSMAR